MWFKVNGDYKPTSNLAASHWMSKLFWEWDQSFFLALYSMQMSGGVSWTVAWSLLEPGAGARLAWAELEDPDLAQLMQELSKWNMIPS